MPADNITHAVCREKLFLYWQPSPCSLVFIIWSPRLEPAHRIHQQNMGRNRKALCALTGTEQSRVPSLKAGILLMWSTTKGDFKWLIHAKVVAQLLMTLAISAIRPWKKFPAPIAGRKMSVSTTSVKGNLPQWSSPVRPAAGSRRMKRIYVCRLQSSDPRLSPGRRPSWR